MITSLAMLAFAANSLLARLALATDELHPAVFTALRLISGALALLLFVRLTQQNPVEQNGKPNWIAAFALFVYAAAFAFAYVLLAASTGALILFATVQASLIAYGIFSGQKINWIQAVGIGMGVLGIVVLMLPGVFTPDWRGALLMMLAGIAWAVYTLQGGTGDPVLASRDNFLRASLLCVVLVGWIGSLFEASMLGMVYAVSSGVLASAGGYILWYAALRELNAIDAATVQLSVPIITALMGVVLLSEPMTLRIGLAFFLAIAGIGLSIRFKHQ